MAVGDENVVNGVDVSGMEPDRGADAVLGNGRKIGDGNEVPQSESDRRRLQDDGVQKSGLRGRPRVRLHR